MQSISYPLTEMSLDLEHQKEQQYIFDELVRPRDNIITQIQRPEILDECGFVVMTPEQKRLRTNRIANAKNTSGFQRSGMGAYTCKGLCNHLPHVTSRTVDYNTHHWCSECEIAMPCTRCRCCGRIGRKNTRHNRKSREVRRIE